MDTNLTKLIAWICFYSAFLTKGAFGNAKNRHANKTYVVTAVVSKPYIKYKQHYGPSTWPPEPSFEGLFVDVLERISKRVGFQYHIRLVADGKYGSEFRPDMWNGMVGELIEGKADIAIGDLTITSKRAEVVSFSQPFIEAGLRILYKKSFQTTTVPEKAENVLVLLQPFSYQVWIVLVIIFVIASVLLYLVARFSPLEKEKISHSSAFTIDKCFLYTLKSLTLQGIGDVPMSFSVRVLSATWWCVCLIVVASYIAGLTALCLTKEPPAQPTRSKLPFSSFSDLARQTNVKYGTVQAGSTYQYFRNSEGEMEKRMFSFMVSEKPSVFVTTYDEGIKRVRESGGDYAFIAESTFAEYHANQLPCDLTVLGQPISSRAFGFACSKANSELCNDIDVGILRLKEGGMIEQLKNKWFSGPCSTSPETSVSYQVSDSDIKSSASMVTTATLGRMLFAWITFLVGSVLSLVVLGLELCLRGRKRQKTDRSDPLDDQQPMGGFAEH